ncbi:helix-turn-helix domain-containing protein [Duganella sp. FT92W]|uniref:Helix-turn-helix domain-containing protein n=1 Tax=Pseudoduganella rivuli TaxID=2666085 RepID=A0A7X2INQ8_9BURK|nr:helix-turn-helix domain-containing protein [Pseudoduganella rivuli]MRV72848.1 helix-turn-helix domain-containing protein [Pseudoduganella rivuli]
MSQPPVQVAMYADADCWLGSIHLIRELLAVAGTLQRGPALFDVTVVGPTSAPVASFTGTQLTPDVGVEAAPPAQVIFLPAFYFPDRGRRAVGAALAAWLRQAYADGAIIVAITSSVRLLAETGLLDGREAACNPADWLTLRNHYPAIHCLPDAPLAIDGRVVTAASINPAIDACAYLVAHFYGDKAARKLARFANSTQQPSYGQFALASAAWRQHPDDRIRQAQAYIERQFMQPLTVPDVARRASMSERNFNRRFAAAVGMPPARYIMRCRIEHAKQLLSQQRVPVLTVALQCGFNDENAFRRAFRQLCGVTPGAYRGGGT